MFMFGWLLLLNIIPLFRFSKLLQNNTQFTNYEKINSTSLSCDHYFQEEKEALSYADFRVLVWQDLYDPSVGIHRL